jgi:hypothetical protein
VTLTLSVAAPLALSLERVPLSFSDVQLRRIFAAPRRIAEELAANFIADAILMSPALLGSLQVLGNPLALIRAFAAGVGELVAAPLHAARGGEGLLGMAGALAGGGRYLASRTLGGVLTSFAGITTALARNVDRLSFDGAHVARREALRQRQRHSELLCLTPAAPGEGAAAGAASWPLVNGLWGGFFSVGSSLASGVGGVVALPFTTVRSLAAGESVGGAVGGAVGNLVSSATSLLTKVRCSFLLFAQFFCYLIYSFVCSILFPAARGRARRPLAHVGRADHRLRLRGRHGALHGDARAARAPRRPQR